MERTVRIHTDSVKPDNRDHRLVVIRWKATTSNPKPHSAMCVSIPALEIDVRPICLKDAMLAAMNDIQDTIIREAIEEKMAATPGLTIHLYDALYSYEGIAAWAAENAISGKLSKEMLQTWFDAVLHDTLMLEFANRLELPDNMSEEQKQRLNKAVSGFRSAISSLASPRTNIDEKNVRNIKAAIALVETDKITASINSRLEKFLKPVELSLEDLG